MPKKENSADQDLFHIMVAQGIKIAIGMEQQLAGQKDPRVLSEAILSIIERIETEGRSNGMDFPLNVVRSAGEQIATIVFVVAGLGEQDVELIKQVVGNVTGKYMEKNRRSGRITNEQLNQLAQEEQPQQNMEQPNG
jgi:hypothetical protein